jgi:hypothetical protein
MGYKLGQENVDINLIKQTKIAAGNTGDVYKYKGVAVKVFKEDKKLPIDEDTSKYLSTIKTDRILLPKKLLFNNNAFKGYSYKLVSKKGTGKKIITLSKEELINNIKILENDIENLSSKKVLLNGLIPENIIFNGELYLVDPTKYTILDLYSTQELEILNKYQLHLLLTKLINIELRKEKVISPTRKDIDELLSIKDDYESSSSFVQRVLSDSENIKELIKKI